MPGVCRNFDLGTTGHGCTTVVPVLATQFTVFVNGRAMEKIGDPAIPHKILVGKKCVGHLAVINAGAPSVFCKGIPVARIGDSMDGGAMITGSSNVFAGGTTALGMAMGFASLAGGIAGAVSGGIPGIGAPIPGAEGGGFGITLK
jgi:uncharacterized Zn-binding protein involved in type VI secretion